jgi:hypothetical protein
MERFDVEDSFEDSFYIQDLMELHFTSQNIKFIKASNLVWK